jgi:hypothetical protein
MERQRGARALFQRLLAACSNWGLLSEEYDAKKQRQVGNLPQAFSHVLPWQIHLTTLIGVRPKPVTLGFPIMKDSGSPSKMKYEGYRVPWRQNAPPPHSSRLTPLKRLIRQKPLLLPGPVQIPHP